MNPEQKSAIYKLYSVLARAGKALVEEALTGKSQVVPLTTDNFLFIPKLVPETTDKFLAENVALAYLTSAFTPEYKVRIHPLDFSPFPSYLSEGFEWVHSQPNLLNTLNNPSFAKTAHLYFLKALLFDDDFFNTFVDENIIRTDSVRNTLRAHVRNQRSDLKQSLMQVPEFRKNVIKYFDEYKERINKDFGIHSSTTEKANKKLDSLHSMVKRIEGHADKKVASVKADSDEESFKKAFGEKEFDPNNDFHQYAMQMLIVSENEYYNTEKLLSAIKKQARDLQLQLQAILAISPDAGIYYQELRDAFRKSQSLSTYSHWEQAIILFNADKNVSKNIRNKLNETALKKEEVPLDSTKSIAAMQNKQKMEEAIQAVQIILQELDLLSERLSGAGEIKNKLSQIKVLLSGCVEHGKQIYSRGDVESAISYLNKINEVAKILKYGIENNYSNENIASNMIAEIVKADATGNNFENNNFFEWMTRVVVKFFTSSQITLSGSSVLTPLLATHREKKLADVVTQVCQLPEPTAPLRLGND